MTSSVSSRLYAYVGHGNPTGDILIFAVDAITGTLTPLGTVATGASTSYLAFHPNKRFAYTTQNRANRLTAFAIDPQNGQLERINDVAVPARPGATDAGPAYVSVDATGRFLLAANYRGHNAVVFQLGPDGKIGALAANVSAGEHAHSILLAPDNGIALVPFLGADQVAQYRLGADGGLTPQEPPAVTTAPGSGPRHIVFAPDGKRAFVIGELDARLYGFDYDADRRSLVPRWDVDTLPGDYAGRRWAADVHVHPNGRIVYASNRAHESLAVFALADGGPPSLVQRIPSGGATPRNFSLDPAGGFLYVANQDSGNLVTFAIDADGSLRPIATREVAPQPYYVKLLAL
jgi:6-phosphogluconolactonase